MTVYTSAQINSLSAQSTSAILAHFGTPVTIQVVRSEKTNTPCIVFHADSGLLCTVLAIKHANDLAKMQPDWQPMSLKASKDKEGQYFSVIPLKGLRPSTLRSWLTKGRNAGFVIDDQVLCPAVHAEVVSTEVVESIPTTARPVAHKPFGLPGKVATVKELRQVLRAQGKCTSGNKAALLARL